jgi:hypothetical protein
MEAKRGLVELNSVELSATGTSWTFGYWFSFTYYAPPALLVEREARMR